MTTASSSGPSNLFSENVIDAFIKLVLLALLLSSCFLIVRPFMMLVVWAIVLAVAVYPLFLKLRSLMGGKGGLAAAVFALLGITLLLLPSLSLGGSLIDSLIDISRRLNEGALDIPPPPDSVAGWPLIGESVSHTWNLASTNIDSALEDFSPQLKAIAAWLLHAVGGAVGSLLQFIVSVIIAGVLLAHAEGGHRIFRSIATRLVGEKGQNVVSMSTVTIRSVALGVLGVALIQSILAAIGLVLADVPGAEILALAVLLLAIMQLPPLLILLPAALYVFSVESTGVAVAFAAWSLFVSVSDSFLKPLLLGRGVDVPMLVILLGAIGGMIAWGVIGLFVGAVMLALGYKLFYIWLDETQEVAEEAS
jgi:predicted PurR-regulated permease PerM